MNRHRHHIVPKFDGGDNDPMNITPPISIRMHAMFHLDRWRALGKAEDRASYLLLRGLISSDDARRIASVAARARAVAAMTPEERSAKWGVTRGKKASIETRTRMSASRRLVIRAPMSDASRLKMSATKKKNGWKPSEEHKLKIGAAARGNKNRLGIRWTEEQKKMFRRPCPATSESNRRRAAAARRAS